MRYYHMFDERDSHAVTSSLLTCSTSCWKFKRRSGPVSASGLRARSYRPLSPRSFAFPTGRVPSGFVGPKACPGGPGPARGWRRADPAPSRPPRREPSLPPRRAAWGSRTTTSNPRRRPAGGSPTVTACASPRWPPGRRPRPGACCAAYREVSAGGRAGLRGAQPAMSERQGPSQRGAAGVDQRAEGMLTLPAWTGSWAASG